MVRRGAARARQLITHPGSEASEFASTADLIVNRDKPPFNNPDLRRAMALSFDREAFIDILIEGEGDIGGVMQQPPAGLWGMPPELLQALTGYDPDVQKNRAEARQVMQKLGYGPDSRLKIKVSVRDLPYLRDPAVIMIDQMKQVYIDGDLETIDTTNWFPKVMRKDYIVGLNQRRKWARRRPESPTALRVRRRIELQWIL